MNYLGKPEINADLQLPLLTEVGMKQMGKYTVLIGKLPYGLQDIITYVEMWVWSEKVY